MFKNIFLTFILIIFWKTPTYKIYIKISSFIFAPKSVRSAITSIVYEMSEKF